MTTQSITRNRPLVWEDDAPSEPRSRRVQQSAPPPGRALPGLPLHLTDPDDDSTGNAGTRSGGQRFERPRNPWWRPASTAGRVFLGLVALVVVGGFATSAYLLKSYLSRDGRFRIEGASNIQAIGLTEVSRTEILPVFGEDIGRNIFFVPLAERRKQLEEIPWVERATVMRLLPNQIRVSVVERKPVAFVRQGQQIGLIDANGVLLTMPAAMMAQHHYSFPVVTGIDANASPAARKARMAVYQRLLAELDANSQRISEQISEIDLTDTEDAQVLMPEQGGDILAHFGSDQFLERYQRYKAHINEWRQQYPKLTAVDLRYEQQVVLQMAPGTNVAQAAADAQSAAAASAEQQNADSAGTNQMKQAPPVDAAVAKTPKGKVVVKGKAAPKSKPAVKSAGKAGAKTSAKPKSAGKVTLKAAKLKAKKRAELQRAALNANRQKIAPTRPSATIAGMGQ